VTISSGNIVVTVGESTDTGNWPSSTTFDVVVYNVQVNQSLISYTDIDFKAETTLTTG